MSEVQSSRNSDRLGGCCDEFDAPGLSSISGDE